MVNGIILSYFTQDHGYPTKDKGTPEGLKDNKTHDLWLTEDNIESLLF